MITIIDNQKIIFKSLKACNKFLKRSRRPEVSHPVFWYENYPISLIGKRQSPINIDKNQCLLNNKQIELPKLILNYPQHLNDLKIRNPRDDTYFGWRVDIPYHLSDQTLLTGGPLTNRYKLIQFHAHWGKNCSCGSEHTINGKSYAAEFHFVHWNYELYSSARQAAISKDGLAVVAVFLEAFNDQNIESTHSLSTLCNYIPKIKYKGSIAHMNEELNSNELMPQDRSYYTYLGSLTTPPLWETVTWIIFEEPLKCSQKLLDVFRKTSYYSKDSTAWESNVEENYRPVQPLNARQVIYVKN